MSFHIKMETRACVFIWFVVIECVVLDFVKLLV